MSILKFYRAAILAVAALLLATAPGMAQTKPKVRALPLANPTSVLWIGNSFFYFNNGITSHVAELIAARDANAKMRGTMVTIGGSGFDWHDVESYFRPNAIGKYTFDRNNNVVQNDPKQKPYEVAVLMDCSACPLHPDLASVFVDYAKRHIDTVRRHDVVPVLFMSWAYADKPEMTAGLAEAYTKAGNDNDALVIPAGLAFARAIHERPTINLYIKDKRHPTQAGTYLAAATAYAALLGRSPVDLSYSAGLDPEDAKFLQTVAWSTVQDYYKP